MAEIMQSRCATALQLEWRVYLYCIMSMRADKPVIINGKSKLLRESIMAAIGIIILTFIQGFEVVYFFVPAVIFIHLVSYPFRRIVEISPELLVIRRIYRKLGKVTKFKIDEVRSAATVQSLYHYGTGSRDSWLVLHFKDERVEKVFLGTGFDRYALEHELGKYVEIFTPNLLDL